ncbi:GSCFA domain-containing protein [Chitinophaga horti]|uniref:GSCFA domain-containing protein n=1 Tax=Chitinophaga horti TaxID=2920382 RepID=A0ABY6J443_9BACT|nr:GSCFA domain-containing protein [Chitinophaga horti]UYQ94392.1 GSCFA domain-containing protein [Chitinophaga horti]
MDFHLQFPVMPLPQPIQYDQKILMAGSCFAEEVGAMLQSGRFDVMLNPNGILFNPLSIVKSVNQYLDQRTYTEADLFQHNGAWHSYDHHSRFSGTDKEAVLAQINASQAAAAKQLKEADWLIITLGSAFGYTLKEGGQLVGNCHKMPQQQFNKKLHSAEEIITAIDNMMHRLFFANRKVKIIFTVSPVRYVRDGVVENNLSKAILLQAVHHLVNKFDRLYYFPAYELVIDDLRDYRFYKEDMVHPNAQAVQYVWEKFAGACLHQQAQATLKLVEDVSRARRHRPIIEDSEQHRQFLAGYAQKVRTLMEQHPYLDLKEELQYFSRG